VADTEEFSSSLSRVLRMLDRCQIPRDTVTLVFEKGSAALANTVELQQAGVGWISGENLAGHGQCPRTLYLKQHRKLLPAGHAAINYSI
jgi:hypothetical protein